LYALRKATSGAFMGAMPRYEQPMTYEEPKIEPIQEKK
jgi:hypothetical protein